MNPSYNVLLPTIGSAGDLFPVVALALELKKQGHKPFIIATAYFEKHVLEKGIDFISLADAEAYIIASKNPDLWHPQKGFAAVARSGIIPGMKKLYNIIQEFSPNDTIIGASSLCLGAKLAQEKLNYSLATIVLQPVVFRSLYDTPKIKKNLPSDATPRFIKKFIYWMADKLIIDKVLAPELNKFRKELGLSPARSIFGNWMFSSELVIGLFPDWFASIQPDWIPNVYLTGFPLLDDFEVENKTSDEIEEFLNEKEKPIVFTAGSAMRHGNDFFEIAAKACAHSGRKAAFLSRETENIPLNLSKNIKHISYYPFSKLLSKAKLLVHHGGIGTLSQALKAGIPQLVMPFTHDQPDNAYRLEKMGVCKSLYPNEFTVKNLEKQLEFLLNSETVKDNCKLYSEKMQNSKDGLEKAANLIVGLKKL